MRLDWLESFVAFAETRNFTHAAARLHVSQPALHVQIRKLGDDLGVTLYTRNGRALELTDEGRRVEAFARSMTGQVDEFRRMLAGEAERAPVIVSAGRATHLYLLAEPLRSWVLDGSRRIQLRAETREETVDALLAGRAHVGVAPLDTVPLSIESRPIGTFGTLCVLPPDHPLAKRRRLRVADLDGCRLVLPPSDRPHHATVVAALREAGARADVVIEAGGWELMTHYASLGLGVAVVNAIVPVPSGVRAVPLQGLPRITYHALLARGRLASTDARALFEHLVASRRHRD